MNLTPNEVLIIAVVALVVLGPQRLPEAARQIGKGYRELRKMSTSVRAEIDAAIKEPMEAISEPINEVRKGLDETVSSVSDTIHGRDSGGSSGSDAAAGAAAAGSGANTTGRVDGADVDRVDPDERGSAAALDRRERITSDRSPDRPNSAFRPADELAPADELYNGPADEPPTAGTGPA